MMIDEEDMTTYFASNIDYGAYPLLVNGQRNFPNPSPQNAHFFNAHKRVYAPPPDGLISSQILSDGSNTLVSKADLKSDEIDLNPGILQTLQPGEKRVIYSGNVTMFPGKHQ